MGGSDCRRPRPCPRFLHSFTAAHCLWTGLPASLAALSLLRFEPSPAFLAGRSHRSVLTLGYRILAMSGSTRPRTPGSTPHHWPSRSGGCCLPVGQTPRRSPAESFGAPHLQGRHHPLPLHLACFRADASARLLPVAQQGSILGSWLAITQVGLPPTKVRGIAKPHCPHLSALTVRCMARAGSASHDYDGALESTHPRPAARAWRNTAECSSVVAAQVMS
jgi:hypothetical protein